MRGTTGSPDEGDDTTAPEPADTAPPEVRTLCSVPDLDSGNASSGPLWTLAEPERQLDANLIRLGPGESVREHTEHQLDVLLHVVSGDGAFHGQRTVEQVGAGSVLWLPRGATRSISAGKSGLSYLTVHQRRPGLWIGTRSDAG